MADTREAYDLPDRKALAFELTDTVITHALGQSFEMVRLVWFEQRLRKLKRVSITHMSAITEAIAIGLARGAKCKKTSGNSRATRARNQSYKYPDSPYTR